MRNNCCKFISLALSFYKNFFYKKTLYFLLFLPEFDLFIDFQSPDVVHAQSRSTLEFCMILVNDDWTFLYNFFSTFDIEKVYSTFSFFSCGKNR